MGPELSRHCRERSSTCLKGRKKESQPQSEVLPPPVYQDSQNSLRPNRPRRADQSPFPLRTKQIPTQIIGSTCHNAVCSRFSFILFADEIERKHSENAR